MEKVSVIVPVYNTEKYLEKSINSIVNQTYKNLEILLIDDGSTDRSFEICKKFAQKDNRVIPIHKENSGVSETRNLGISYATGKYAIFVDSDDILPLNSIKDMYEVAKKNNSDLVIGMININNKNCDNLENNKEANKISSFEILKDFFLKKGKFNLSSSCGKLYSNKIYKLAYFEKDRRTNEDRDYVFQVLTIANNIFAYCDTVYYYNIHENSSSTKVVDDRYFDILYFSEKMYSFIIKSKYKNLEKYALLNKFNSYLHVYRKFCKNKSVRVKYSEELNNIELQIFSLYNEVKTDVGLKRKIEVFIIKYLNSLYKLFIGYIEK